MKQLTIEEEARIGEMIAERLRLKKRGDDLYLVGVNLITPNGIYHALREVMQELREKEGQNASV